MITKPFQLQDVTIGGDELFFILGPCAIESEEFTWHMAREIKKIADELGIQWIFKASFDKANRTSAGSYRGPGVEEGTALLGAIGKELGVPVTTDIHTPEQAAIAAKHIDLLQIPAFLCRQTDLLQACAETGYWMAEQGNFVIFDATHSVQRPGGDGGTTGGDGILAPVLARAAVATGVNGVFMETHENPAEAMSDGPNQVPLKDLRGVLESLVAINACLK